MFNLQGVETGTSSEPMFVSAPQERDAQQMSLFYVIVVGGCWISVPSFKIRYQA